MRIPQAMESQRVTFSRPSSRFHMRLLLTWAMYTHLLVLGHRAPGSAALPHLRPQPLSQEEDAKAGWWRGIWASPLPSAPSPQGTSINPTKGTQPQEASVRLAVSLAGRWAWEAKPVSQKQLWDWGLCVITNLPPLTAESRAPHLYPSLCRPAGAESAEVCFPLGEGSSSTPHTAPAQASRDLPLLFMKLWPGPGR